MNGGRTLYSNVVIRSLFMFATKMYVTENTIDIMQYDSKAWEIILMQLHSSHNLDV